MKFIYAMPHELALEATCPRFFRAPFLVFVRLQLFPGYSVFPILRLRVGYEQGHE